MGTLREVHCAACGYRSDTLRGVGGEVGVAPHVLATVSCPTDRALHDTQIERMPEELASEYGAEGYEGMPLVPTGACRACGKKHALWDPATAICPACRTPGCVIEDVGKWD